MSLGGNMGESGCMKVVSGWVRIRNEGWWVKVLGWGYWGGEGVGTRG